MTHLPFRHYHALQVLQTFDAERGPLDGYMRVYFKENTAIGSKDRREVSETVYNIVRWQGLLDALYEDHPSWRNRLDCFLKTDVWKENPSLPPHHQVSFPENLFSKLVESHGEAEAMKICFASNSQAPVTIRSNSIKISRHDLLTSLQKKFPVTPCKLASCGIQFSKRLQLFSLPEYEKGWFEVQDEGSQLLADLVDAKPGDHILDLCAGSGGKSLAIAPKMDGKGQLYLYDIRAHILAEAKKRLKHAGAQNVQFLDQKGLKRFKGKMDWVLVDSPCSGTGTLRRNPDMKWRFSEEQLQELVKTQREIVEQAIQYLKPGGTLVYATCSLLADENEKQIEFFEKELGLVAKGEPFVSLPTQGGADGFFGQALGISVYTK